MARTASLATSVRQSFAWAPANHRHRFASYGNGKHAANQMLPCVLENANFTLFSCSKLFLKQDTEPNYVYMRVTSQKFAMTTSVEQNENELARGNELATEGRIIFSNPKAPPDIVDPAYATLHTAKTLQRNGRVTQTGHLTERQTLAVFEVLPTLFQC